MALGNSGAQLQIIPEVFDPAMQAAAANEAAFVDTQLRDAVIVKPTFPQFGPGVIGNMVSVPYFETIGDFQQMGGIANDGTGTLADGVTPLAIRQAGMTKESEFVTHAGLPFQITQWAESNPFGSLTANAVKQVMEALKRDIDYSAITAAIAQGGLIWDKYSASAPQTLNIDMFTDARTLYGDMDSDIVGMIVHSQTMANMRKLKNQIGQPLLVENAFDDGRPRFQGIPVVMSDRMPITGGTLPTVPTTITGASPPVVTFTAADGVSASAPTQFMNLLVQVMVIGPRGTAAIRWSLNGGASWVQDGVVNPYVVIPAGGTPIPVIDTMFNATGVYITCAAGTYALTHTYAATTIAKHTTLLLKKASIVYWFNASAIRLRQVEVPVSDSTLSALHVYKAVHAYKRVGRSQRPGVVMIRHN